MFRQHDRVSKLRDVHTGVGYLFQYVLCLFCRGFFLKKNLREADPGFAPEFFGILLKKSGKFLVRGWTQVTHIVQYEFHLHPETSFNVGVLLLKTESQRFSIGNLFTDPVLHQATHFLLGRLPLPGSGKVRVQHVQIALFNYDAVVVVLIRIVENRI